MSQETLTISKDAALKAHGETNRRGRRLLENLLGEKVFQKEIMERILSFEDICKEMKKDPKNYIPKDGDLDDARAKYLLKWELAAECFNEGKIVDFANSNQKKHTPWYKYNPVSGWSFNDVADWDTATTVGSRQHFLNPDHVRHIDKHMPEIFIDFIK